MNLKHIAIHICFSESNLSHLNRVEILTMISSSPQGAKIGPVGASTHQIVDKYLVGVKQQNTNFVISFQLLHNGAPFLAQ